MPTPEALETAIRAALLRAVATGAMAGEIATLDALMSNIASRDSVYRCAFAMCDEDAPKRRRVGQLMLTYALGFPPSEASLVRLEDACHRFAARHDTDCPFTALRDVFQTMKVHMASCGDMLHPIGSPSAAASSANQAGSAGAAGLASRTLPGSIPQLLRQRWMQPAVRDGHNLKSVVMVHQTVKDVQHVAEEKRREVMPQADASRLSFTVACCKDYVDQRPLVCSESILDQQHRILATYFDGYKSHALVSRATAVIIKLWCDAYVSKFPLLSALRGCDDAADDMHRARRTESTSLLRLVTAAHASLLFQLMESEYHCVRTHVYDMVLTLAAHTQLLDSQGTFAWLPESIEHELVWLVSVLCARQVLMESTDDRLLTAALKCALVITPLPHLHRFDNRALKAFLSLPGLAQRHPHVFVALTEAIACKWLTSEPEKGWRFAMAALERLPSATPPHRDPNNFPAPHHLGVLSEEPCDDGGGIAQLSEAKLDGFGFSLDEVINLYVACPTAASRQHMFAILVSIAVNRVRVTGGDATVTGGRWSEKTIPHLTQRGLSIVMRLCLPWHLHILTLYQSHRCVRELPSFVGVDLSMQVSRELKSFIGAVVQQIAVMLERFHTLPGALRRELAAVATNADGKTPASEQRLRPFAEACCTGIPALLRDSDCNPSQRQVGKTLLLHTLRLLRPSMTTTVQDTHHHHKPADGGVSGVPALVRSIVTSSSSRVRGVMPEVIGGLWILARTQPTQAAAPLHLCLREYVQHESAADTSNLLRLYAHVMEGMCTLGTLDASHEGDISGLVLDGQLSVLQSSVEFLGVYNLWGLYWALRPNTCAAAGRARHVLLAIISAMSSQLLHHANPNHETSSLNAISQIHLWSKVMSDPYPAAALVAAQRVVRIAGLAAYDKYEAAVSELQRQGASPLKLSNAYSMGRRIYEHVVSNAK